MCASGMVTCAFALTLLGTLYEVLHHRVNAGFIGMSTIFLAIFGALAHGASSTIPLDVAIDAQGVTYSGARTPWTAIALVDVEALGRGGRRALVRLHTMAGIVKLGPTSAGNANAIAAAVRAAKA
jgi:hypothetical protein